MKRARALVVVACLSCSGEPRPVATRAALPPGVVASVGGDLVRAETVARIASAQGIDRAAARDLAVRDAVFAAALRSDPRHSASVAVAERAALGRALFEILEKQAEELGPVSDAELVELATERWTELDRPPSVRTAHAVVLVKKPEDAAAARALAERLLPAVRGATSTAEFLSRAHTVLATPPLEIVAEELSPVTEDGRMWDPRAKPGTKFGTVDKDFARAASALANPGDQSPIVKSAFGYHVILLEERIPEQRTTLDERRALLGGEVVARRARKLLEKTLERLRESTPLEVERTADGLTALALEPTDSGALGPPASSPFGAPPGASTPLSP
jgi:peptidyl-prolyl cis-trans isomerase C